MADWGWDWTDCCTVKSNNLSQQAVQPPLPRVPLPPPKMGAQRPYADDRGAAAMRDTSNATQFDGQGASINRNSPYAEKVNGSAHRKSQYSSMYTPPQQTQSSNGGFSVRPASQTQPPRPTSQIGQHMNAPSPQNVGLGIAFQQKLNASDTPRPKLAVKSLAVGSPAFASGQIQVGDVLHTIGDVYVKGMSGSEIAPFILGPPGSEIRMAFERPVPDGSVRMVYVDLARTWTHVGTAPPASQPVLLRQYGAI